MKVLKISWMAVCLGAVIGCQAKDSVDQPLETEIAGVVQRLDPAFDTLVPAGAVIEKVAGGFVFIEGPVWIPGPPGHLLFSDIPGNTVYQWSASEGAKVFLHPVLPEGSVSGGVGGSNGLTLDPQGRLVLCEHGNRRIARLNADGSRTTLADIGLHAEEELVCRGRRRSRRCCARCWWNSRRRRGRRGGL